jgi:hypothetical protein
MHQANWHQECFRIVAGRVAAVDPDLRQHTPVNTRKIGKNLVDYAYASPADPHSPDLMFDSLRWGGQFLFFSKSKKYAVALAARFVKESFEITQPPRHVYKGPRIPFVGRKIYYFVARKVQLIRQGEFTERFTYHVHLTRPSGAGYIVTKEVPTLETVISRLSKKWPDLASDILEKRARKFSDKIFPIFLTREAAILKIVNRDLPEEYRGRVPQVLEIEKDDRGYVRRLYLNWLRNGGDPLTQLEFAKQSADLLRVLHDRIGVMHLDLRMDNFVITPGGVGFVDFGSAVRVDEDLKQNPLLSNLFEELMKTSEIQRMLFKMTHSGQVTSQAMCRGLHTVDKAVDCFYLAVQISEPHTNPDLKGLIQYDPRSEEAQALAKLTQQILRPEDPYHPSYNTAADILRGIERIERSLGERAAVVG